MTADHDEIATTETERALRALHGDDSVWALEADELAQLATFTEIVVPLAPDHHGGRGLTVAAALAERWDVPIRLVSVDETAPAGSVSIAAGGRLEDAKAALTARHPSLAVSDVMLGAVDDPVAALARRLDVGRPRGAGHRRGRLRRGPVVRGVAGGSVGWPAPVDRPPCTGRSRDRTGRRDARGHRRVGARPSGRCRSLSRWPTGSASARCWCRSSRAATAPT